MPLREMVAREIAKYFAGGDIVRHLLLLKARAASPPGGSGIKARNDDYISDTLGTV
jgi:hypothetical protein